MFLQFLFMLLMCSLGHLTRGMVARPQLPRIIILRNIAIGHPVAQGHSPQLALQSQLSLILPLLRLARTKATKAVHFLLVETVEWPKDTKAHLGHPPRPALLRQTGVLPRTDMTKAVPTHPIDRNITTKASGPIIIDLHPIQGTNMAHPIDLDLSPQA